MADWLEEMKRQQQERLAEVAVKEQEKINESQRQEANYLKNKSQIDAKIYEIECFANEINGVLEKKNVWVAKSTGSIAVYWGYNSGGNDSSVNFSFRDKEVTVTFRQDCSVEDVYDSRYGSISVNIDEVTKEKISLWLKWLVFGAKLPVKLKTDTERKDARVLKIIGLILLGIFILIFIYKAAA